MLRYKIIHKNGKEKIIFAKNLEQAEVKANKIWKEWIEIILVDKTRGENPYA